MRWWSLYQSSDITSVSTTIPIRQLSTGHFTLTKWVFITLGVDPAWCVFLSLSSQVIYLLWKVVAVGYVGRRRWQQERITTVLLLPVVVSRLIWTPSAGCICTTARCVTCTTNDRGMSWKWLETGELSLVAWLGGVLHSHLVTGSHHSNIKQNQDNISRGECMAWSDDKRWCGGGV